MTRKKNVGSLNPRKKLRAGSVFNAAEIATGKSGFPDNWALKGDSDQSLAGIGRGGKVEKVTGGIKLRMCFWGGSGCMERKS